jgi:hypothetical protein
MKIIKNVLSISGYVFVIIGFLFKVLHWPFANSLLISGLTLYFISLILSFFKQKEEEKASNSDILDDI